MKLLNGCGAINCEVQSSRAAILYCASLHKFEKSFLVLLYCGLFFPKRWLRVEQVHQQQKKVDQGKRRSELEEINTNIMVRVLFFFTSCNFVLYQKDN